MKRPQFLTPRLTLIVGLVVVGASTVAATAQLGEVFIGNTFLARASIAAIGAAVLVLFAHGFWLSTGESILASLVGFVAVGIPVAGADVSADAAGTFLAGLTEGWVDFLSATPPVDPTDELLVLPFALAWLGVMIGGEVLRVSSRPLPAASGPIITAVSVALISDGSRWAGLVAGAAVAGAVLLLSMPYFRVDLGEPMQASVGSGANLGRGTAAVVSLAVVGVVGAGALLVASVTPWADADDRVDLRDSTPPQFEPLARPSPLSKIKPSVQSEVAADVVFTVVSDDLPTRFTVAALTDFDGVVWAVADAGTAGNAEFRPVGTRFPGLDDDTFGTRNAFTDVEATIKIGSLGDAGSDNVFLPSPGWPLAMDFDTNADVRLNLQSRTAALPAGLAPDLTYAVRSRTQGELTARQLADASFVSTAGAAPVLAFPASILNLHADLVGDDDVGYEVVEAVQEFLAFSGTYSAAISTAPGHSVERLSRFLTDESPTVGYEEQYAAMAGVLLDLSEIKSRVVVGYRIPASRYVESAAEVLAGDISAWVEVQTVEFGWIPIDVTPDRSRVPVDEQLVVDVQDVAVPNAPPALPPADLPDRAEVGLDEDQVDDEEVDEEIDEPDAIVSLPGLSIATIVGIIAALPFLLIAIGAVAIVVAKRRRTKRRRHATDAGERVAGAWADVTERFAEAGSKATASDTPSVVAEQFSNHAMTEGNVSIDFDVLVGAVERAAYHRDEPRDGLAESAWTERDTAVATLRSSRSRTDRFVMSVDPRPLRRNKGNRSSVDA